MKKKILYILLAFFIIASCFGILAASAAEYTDPTVAVECTTVGAEGLEADQFRVDVVVYNNPGIAGYEIELVYDNTKVQVIDVVRVWDEDAEEYKVVSAFPVTPTLSIDNPTYDPTTADRIAANAARAKKSTKSGTYLSVIFKRIADFEETALTLEDVLFVAEDKSPVTFDVVNDTLYKTYLVSFNANGGTDAPASQTKRYGEPLVLSNSIPARTGYTFMGWATTADGSVKYYPGDTYNIDSDITLYAVWKINTYTISYDANGGIGAPASQTKTYGEPLTLSNTVPTRTGYTFMGWATSENGGVEYMPGTDFTVNASTRLYAVWKENTYTVSYNANGGSGAPASQTKTYDIPLNLSAEMPIRTGYIFLGWATSANGNVVYNPGAVYSENADLALYAVWEIVHVSGVTLDKTTATITEGDKLTLTATVLPTNAANKNVTWTSSDPTVATVENGVVTAIGGGTTTITVTTEDGGKTATCDIFVEWAFDPDALTFTMSQGKAVAGRTVKLDVVVSNNPGIAGFALKVGYDSSVMTLVGYECPGLEANSSSFDEDEANNPVGFVWIRTSNYTANETILTLTFEIKEDAPVGEYDISLTTRDVVTNKDHDVIRFNLIGGKINVVECEPGDLNRDGSINSIDAVLLAQFIAGWDVELDEIAADCNGDGKVNSIDAVLLAQFIAGWDVIHG